MNFRLVAYLSGFGLAMGLASVMGLVRPGVESLLWLLFGVFAAIWIARKVPAKHFAHGFLVGLVAGTIAPLIQGAFMDSYLARNPSAAETFKRLPEGMSPRLLVLASAPILGIISGLILGLLTWVAGKLMRAREAAGGAS